MNLVVSLVTCKNEDPNKNESARVLTSLQVFFRRSRAANSAVSGEIPPKFKLIQAFIIVLVTCKNEEDLTRFLPYKSMGFFRRSRAANSAVLGRIWLKFELFRDIIDVLVICKNEEDPIKNESARLLTRLYDIFSDAHGQLTL